MKKENGITLVALIITIIVMLILIAVTINLLVNSDLMKKARTAVDHTIIENEREILFEAVVTTLNNNGEYTLNQQNLNENLPDGWEVEQELGNETVLICTSSKNNIFKVYQNGRIEN